MHLCTEIFIVEYFYDALHDMLFDNFILSAKRVPKAHTSLRTRAYRQTCEKNDCSRNKFTVLQHHINNQADENFRTKMLESKKPEKNT